MSLVPVFTDGQVLFSANLKSAFANTVNIAGDTMTGPLVVPSITTSGVSKIDGGFTSNGTVTLGFPRFSVAGMNVFSTVTSVFSVANTTQTLSQAAFDSGNSTTVLAQAAFDSANAISTNPSGTTSQQTFLTSNGVTVNSSVSFTVFGNNTVVISANGANTTQVGVVQLNDTLNSSSLTQAATANAVKNTFITGNAAFVQANNVNTFAGSAFNIANSALNLSQSAFAVANASTGTGKVSKTGDVMTGNLSITAPGTSLTSSNNVSFPGTLTLAGIDVGTGLSQAQTNANSALNLSISAFGRANAVVQNQHTYLTSNGITVNSATSLTVTGNTTVLLSANLGNTTQAGIVQLNDTVTSTSTVLAATANAVNTAWTTAVAAFAKANTGVAGGSGTQSLTFLSSNGITTNAVTSLTVVGNNTVLLSANLGNTTQAGIVQLNDTVISTFTTQAATANAVTTAFNTGSAAFTRANAAIQNQQTYFTSNGITINSSTSLIVSGNNTVLLSANLGNTTQAGIVQLNDTFTSTLTTQAATANVANTIFNTAKAAFAQANVGNVLKTGDAMTGTLTVPNLTANGNIFTNFLNSNSWIVIPGTVNQVETDLVANGTTQNTALILLPEMFHVIGTCLGGANSAIMINIGAGAEQTIVNRGTTPLNLFPPIGGGIDSQQYNTGIQISAGGGFIKIIQANTSRWVTTSNVIAALAAAGVVKTGDAMTGTLTVPTLTVNTSIIAGSVTSNANVTGTAINSTGVVNSAIISVTAITPNTNYILSMRDSGQVITFSNANATLVNVNTGLPIGFRTVLTQIGTGSVTIRAGAGVTLNARIGSNNTIVSQFGSASLFCYASNTFILDGSIQ